MHFMELCLFECFVVPLIYCVCKSLFSELRDIFNESFSEENSSSEKAQIIKYKMKICMSNWL